MREWGSEGRLRYAALALVAVGGSAVAGVGIAGWATADADGFYMNPTDRYRAPAFARRQPVADSFWQTQAGDQAGTGSTATNAQPAYRSASGS